MSSDSLFFFWIIIFLFIFLVVISIILINKNKKLVKILKEEQEKVEDNKEIAKNYRGHDFMMMQGNTFIRLFPIYLENDVNANPTGGVRKLEYKLVDGEASRILKLVKATDYKVVDEKIIN